MDRFSVVIPTYNSENTIRECLEAVRKLSSKYLLNVEVVIVDAGSKDATIDLAEAYADRVIVSQRISRGAARNLGATIARNGILAFLDSDCIITDEWIRQLRAMNSKLSSTIVSGPVVLAGAKTPVGEAVQDLLSVRLFTLSSLTFSSCDSVEVVTDVPSSNIIVSKDFFEKIGGFPDMNFVEDTLFCSRIIAGGGKIIYLPKLKVVHKKTFDSIIHCSRYFFSYGTNYSRYLKCFPELINRYAIAAFLFLFLLVGSLVFLSINMSWLKYLLAFVVLYFVSIFSYSLLKFRKKHAVLIPLLFTTLVLAYVSGFYFGFFQKNRL